MNQHRGFLGLDSAMMIGFMLLMFLAVMVMHAGIIAMIVPDLHTTINKMPTIHDYDEDGNRIVFETPKEREHRSVFNHQLQDRAEKIQDEIRELEEEYYDGIGDAPRAKELDDQIKELEKQLVDLGYMPAPNIYLNLYWMFGTFSIIILVIIFGFCVIYVW